MPGECGFLDERLLDWMREIEDPLLRSQDVKEYRPGVFDSPYRPSFPSVNHSRSNRANVILPL